MNNLLLPMAGRSSRFPNVRPKWMLAHPDTGRLMALESMKGLNLDMFDQIYFGILQEHETIFQILRGFREELDHFGILEKSRIVLLDRPTSSQSDTVYRMILQERINGSILIKDCDNFFEVDGLPLGHNFVCYSQLDCYDTINPRNKSYVKLDEHEYLLNIVEKKIISNTFSVGGYGFREAEEFVDSFLKISAKFSDSECYVSNIIYDMLIHDQPFKGQLVSQYLDWGTIQNWNEYKKQFRTIFCDLDGTLITNTSWHFPPYLGEGHPIQKNIDTLKRIAKTATIIITTSRPDRYREMTIQELRRLGIPYYQLIMGLPHGKRTVINDYTDSNPYPTCDSINIPRNSDLLHLD